MRRQPPIARCFVALCVSAAVTLAAFEWRNPFPDPVITLGTAPEIDADAIISIQGRKSGAKPKKSGRFERAVSWLPLGQSQRVEAVEESPVELILSLSQRLLEVRVPGEETVLYEVAVGQADWQTPTGDFSVINKLENPAWQHPITKEEIPPGPDNPLGTHWISFWSDGQAQIGFHGTNQEDLIGEAVSHGCVRMRNKDIQALYKHVAVGTSVKVKL